MNTMVLLYAFLIAASIVALVVIVTTLKRRNAPGSTSLSILGFTLAAWSFSYLLELLQVIPTAQLSRSIAYLAGIIAPTTLLTFSLEYTNRNDLLRVRNLIGLLVLPAVSIIILWTNPWQAFVNPQSSTQVVITSTMASVWIWLNAIYANTLILLAIYYLVRTYIRSSMPYRMQSGTVLIGTMMPIVIGNLNLYGIAPPPGLDLPLVAYTITGIFFTWDLYANKLLDIIPIARDEVLEKISDGWMILDDSNRIVDLNPAAELIIGHSRDEIFGLAADQVLSNWENLIQNKISKELELRGSVNMGDEWRYYNVRISPLPNGNNPSTGKIIIWRDITERRKKDDARQRARDEMFILLHSISSASSRAMNLHDFLADSIYQIVYSFNSQFSAIFLLDEKRNPDDDRRMVLAAHHGLSTRSADTMSTIFSSHAITDWSIESKEPLLIPDISVDDRIPANMRQAGKLTLLLVPMTIEDRTLGLIGLARKSDQAYSADEITRLSVVADEVAAHIHSDRQRQFAIAMAERHRLVRDMHDSVTQKLYGLLTLTEAAQAGLDATSPDMPSPDISRLYVFMGRIGETARQALKEMRLFLHELQPLDLEREGLVAVLHQRLAAVEGRSDVKARLLADDNVLIPPDKEVALYFIAQEALNNILRHAGARSVTVHLKQKKTSTILEIQDDGCGFDPENSDNGGMGLRNIRERAAQIGGRLKINSTPGKGTSVNVTIKH